LRFSDGALHELGGAERATTNNRMELTATLALLEALAQLPCHPDLSIRTDSRYVIDGLSKWLPGWKRKGWRTASGGPVLNRDLWEKLDRARLAHVPLAYVKGHSGDPDNDRCDAIAVAFSKGRIPQLVAGERLEHAHLELDLPGEGAGTGERAGGEGSGEEEGAGEGEDAGPAPVALQQLLSRLELADRLAAGGFALSLVELAQLVEQPLRRLEQRSEAWPWRDWLIEPVEGGSWRLRRDATREDGPKGG
jgi:ribonuclease HI